MILFVLLFWWPWRAGAAPIPAEALGVELEAQLQDRYATGEALPLKGSIRDPAQAGGQILFNFTPRAGGEEVQVFIDLEGTHFAGYQVFRHDQAGAYDLEVFLGGKGEESLGRVGRFEGLQISQGSGPILLPADFFPGILLDGPFSTEYETGQEILLAGSVRDPAKAGGQVLFDFVPRAGGTEKQVFIDLQGERFESHQVFRHEESGRYELEVYSGGKGEERLEFAGRFGVEVRQGSGEVLIPARFFAGVVLDQALPARLLVGQVVEWAGQVEGGVAGLRLELEGESGTRVLPVGVEGGRFYLPLRLREEEKGRLLLRVVVEREDGSLFLGGEFQIEGVVRPFPRLEVGALALGLAPGGQAELQLLNSGAAALSGLRYEIEGAFAVEGPGSLAPGARGAARLRYTGRGGENGLLEIHSDDPLRPVQRVALHGLEPNAAPVEMRQLRADSDGRLRVELDQGEYLLVLYSAQAEGQDTSAVYPFAMGGGMARPAPVVAAPDSRDLVESALRRQEQELAARFRGHPLPAGKRSGVEYRVGDRRRFVFPAIGGVPEQAVEATVKAISSGAVAWAQDNTPSLDTRQIQRLIDQFSQQDYTLAAEHFGLPSDVDGDQRVSFLFTPLVDRIGGVGGFYSAGSVLPEEVGGNGNLTDLVFLSPTQRQESYRSLLVHEFQHLINFNQHVLVRRGAGEANWLNEGLSHLAEDLVAGYALSGQGEIIAAFLESPSAVGLEGEALMDRRKRGAAYLFVRSLVDRLGEGVLLRLVGTGLADRENAETATGEGVEGLLEFWGAQLYLSGLGLNPHPLFNYQSDLLRAGEGRGFPLPAALEYRPGGPGVRGSLRPRGVGFVRLRGAGTVEVQADPAGKMGGVLVRLPRSFVPQVQVPADYFPGLRFTRLMPGRFTAGEEYGVEGQVLSDSIEVLLFRFAGADTLKFFSQVERGQFAQTLRFEKAGEYLLEVFAGPENGLLNLAGRFGPVQVGEEELTAVEAESALPQRFALGPAYPNPFNSGTILPLVLPSGAGQVEVAIYDALGQRVRVLVRGELPPGAHGLVWDGRDERGARVGSGVYFYRLEAGAFTAVRKLALVR